MRVLSSVSQVIPTSTSHILYFFHSYSAVSVQGLPFEGSSNITEVVLVKVVSSHISTSTVSGTATSYPG